MKAIIEIDKYGEYWICNEAGGKFMGVGTGTTIEEAKADFLQVCKKAREDYKKSKPGLPKELKEPVYFIPDPVSFSSYFANLVSKPAKTPKQRARLQLHLNNFGRAFANFAF